ncbi:MAG: hypothetical protein LBK60_01440 [Verrucomicrobiales bacterium]|jgi:hypothetical protein|nr:hypothetical protein [Verrucomicrobiales bacterium]
MGSNIEEYRRNERCGADALPDVSVSLEAATGLTLADLRRELELWRGARMRKVLAWLILKRAREKTAALLDVKPEELVARQQEIRALREVLPLVDKPTL